MNEQNKSYFVQLSGATIWPKVFEQLSPFADLKFGILDDRNIPTFKELFPSARFLDGTAIKHGIWSRNHSGSLPDEIRCHPAFLRREQQAYYGMQRHFTGGRVSYTDMRLILSSLADYLWGLFEGQDLSFGVLTEAPHTHGGQILAGIAEACEIPLLHFQQTSICSAVRPVLGPTYSTINFRELETEDQRTQRQKFLEQEAHLVEKFVADAVIVKRYARELSLLEKDKKLFRGPKGVLRRFFIPYFWRSGEYKLFHSALQGGADVPYSIGAMSPKDSKVKAVILPALSSTFDQKRRLKECRTSLREIAVESVPTRYSTFFLHFEPEKTSVPDGDLFGDQVLAVRRCVAALGDATTLVVREHPSQLTFVKRGFRARSANFYREIGSIPNISVVSDLVPHEKILPDSEIVFTLTGKVALEALALRIPVVALGHAWYNGVPGVFAVDRLGSVQACVDAARSFEFPSDFNLSSEILAALENEFLLVRVNPSSDRHFQADEDVDSLFNILRFMAEDDEGMRSSFLSLNDV